MTGHKAGKQRNSFPCKGYGNSWRPASRICTLAKSPAFANHHPVSFREKIVERQALPQWCAPLRAAGKQLVVTNGCFDLLHVGHISYLERARSLGDALLVALNGDDSVRQLKGPDRPVNCQEDRAALLAALESVTAVCIFAERTAMELLAEVKPDVYVKGGDYTLDTVNQEERHLIEKLGGRIEIVPGIPGKSTTALLKKIAQL